MARYVCVCEEPCLYPPPLNNTHKYLGKDNDAHKDIQIQTPRLDALPLLDISFNPLFQCLSSDHITCLLHWMLIEGKILLVSEKPCLLAHVAELLRAMILPFEWTGAYIPLCPDYMSGFIRAILPFLIGRTCVFVLSSTLSK